MKLLLISCSVVILPLSLPSCMMPDMDRTPDRLVRVVDSDKNRPVAGLPLVYQSLSPQGIVAREVLTSRPYVTALDGAAHVPSGVELVPGPGSGYVVDSRPDTGKTAEEIAAKNVIFVRTAEMHRAYVRDRATGNP